MSAGLPLMKNPLAPKSNLFPLGITAAALATNAAIPKKMFGSGTTLIISDEEMNGILKIVKYLEDSGLLKAGAREIITSEAKEQKSGLLGILLGTLGATLLGNVLAGKGVLRAGE